MVTMSQRVRLSDSITAKLDPQMRYALERVARQRERNMSELARGYIEEGLRRDGVAC
jgi:hypothetical protein